MILYQDNDHALVSIFNSTNRKTGPMIQTWIMNKESLEGGACNDCTALELCYVFQGKKGVQKKLERGGYEEINVNLERKRVRVGTYGDPTVFPLKVWQDLGIKKHTGYTHFWRLPHVQEYKSFLLASVETLESYHLAKELGWKVFYNMLDVHLGLVSIEQVLEETSMIECPNIEHDLTCFECMLCDPKKGGKDIYIKPHGGRLSKKNALATIEKNEAQNKELIRSLLSC
jgi:hypothetical protein